MHTPHAPPRTLAALLTLGLALAGCPGEGDKLPVDSPADTGPPPADGGPLPAGEVALPVLDQDGDGVRAPLDCDDGDAAVYPGAAEACDLLDNDCDGRVDEGGTEAIHPDQDRDGYGTSAATDVGCPDGGAWVSESGDCDDLDDDVYPGAEELCDAKDNDCDGEVDEALADGGAWYTDLDGDGYGDPETGPWPCRRDGTDADNALDCDDERAETWPGAPEVCDHQDNDCDGDSDEDLPEYDCYDDDDFDGYGDADDSPSASCDPACSWDTSPYNTDCDDDDGEVHPGATETCDLVDEDCDGEVDEDFVVGVVYADRDRDGFGDPDEAGFGCTDAFGYVEDGTDCEPRRGACYPGAAEVCDNYDNDCDGDVDEGFETALYYADDDEDGYGDPDVSATLCLVSRTWVSDSTDCAPRDEERNPGVAEDCADGKDDDCDGLLDCEDTDCEGADGCQETDCDDYRDNDDDGDRDCDDDECWGTADCPGRIVSRVTRTGYVKQSTGQSSSFERSSCDDDLTTQAGTERCTVWGAEEVLGSARLLTPDGGSAPTVVS